MNLLVFYDRIFSIRYYASSGTSPGRSGAFGATETQYLSQKETHETHPYQRIFLFIINNLKQRHSGFFAVFGLHRRTVLYNAKKTGIQIRPAAMNAHFPSYKIHLTRAVPHSRLPKIDSGLFAAWHNLRYTSFLHREKPE